ncbi:MAG: type II toxin-antitoxin system RelE/ParE family toxin [Bacteroidota bacterium]|nr:type II toxin-antitoxin system RelE/ParE family toxin [Bacteroidota bacterium]
MAYQITIRRKAIKILENISEPYYSKIKKAIYSLATNPRPPGCKKLKGRNGYRIRVADYRIIYEILDKALIIDVINLGHRKEIY